MPLEETVENLEGIDEAYHDLYVENSDGKFEINISGLKSALTKERTSRKELEKKLNTNNDDPPDIEELKVQLKSATDKINTMKITSKLKNAALAAGVDADYVDDVITLTKSNFSLDTDGKIINVGVDGEPTGKSVDNFFKADFKKSKPRFYVNSGRKGSGMQPNLNGEGPLSFNGKLQKAITEKNTLEIVKLKNSKIK